MALRADISKKLKLVKERASQRTDKIVQVLLYLCKYGLCVFMYVCAYVVSVCDMCCISVLCELLCVCTRVGLTCAFACVIW